MTITKPQLKYVTNVGFAADFGGRGFSLPTSMVLRSDGVIFVASRGKPQTKGSNGIQLVTANHEFLGQIGSYGSDLGGMIWPTAVALDSDENLYLADEFLHRITIFDKKGDPIKSWGTQGSAEGQINGPSGLLFDANDDLLVVDHRNNRIQKFSKDGKFIKVWAGSFGDGDGNFNLPWGIAQDRDHNVYVADWRNDRIQKFTSDGQFLTKFGTPGENDGEFHRPAGLAIDSEDNIYVADWGNQRVQVFDPEGHFLTKIRGEAGLNPWAIEYLDAQVDEKRARSSFVPVYQPDTDDPSEISARMEPYFWDPVDVLIDEHDRVYVLETGRHRFQIYEKTI